MTLLQGRNCKHFCLIIFIANELLLILLAVRSACKRLCDTLNCTYLLCSLMYMTDVGVNLVIIDNLPNSFIHREFAGTNCGGISGVHCRSFISDMNHFDS